MSLCASACARLIVCVCEGETHLLKHGTQGKLQDLNVLEQLRRFLSVSVFSAFSFLLSVIRHFKGIFIQLYIYNACL